MAKNTPPAADLEGEATKGQQRSTGTAMATKDPAKALRADLKKMESQFQMALPPHVTVDVFTRNLITACQADPKLLQCDRRTLMQSAMTAAQLGLLVGSALGQAYIIPFNNQVPGGNKGQKRLEAVFIPGYRGYITLAYNSGEIESLMAAEVCENDDFDYQLGFDIHIRHRPAMENRGQITHVYCATQFKAGGKHLEVMTVRDVEKVRARAQSKDSPAWKNHWMMMARKTVIRRAAKYFPLSVQRLAALDAAYEFEGKRLKLEEGTIIEGDVISSTISDPEDQALEPQPDPGAQQTVTAKGSGEKTTREEPPTHDPKDEAGMGLEETASQDTGKIQDEPEGHEGGNTASEDKGAADGDLTGADDDNLDFA